MANINTPISAAATNTQAEDTVQNPTTVNDGNLHGNVFFLTLVFGPGRTCDPNAIYDMVDGTYGTVASQKETVARNSMILKIEA